MVLTAPWLASRLMYGAARERNREAADRTLMARIRTSLSLIGFDFGIDAIVQTLQETALGNAPNLALNARILGLDFIAVALFPVIGAMAQYRLELTLESGNSGTSLPSR